MLIPTKRTLIASLTTAVLATSSLAQATVTRVGGTALAGHPIVTSRGLQFPRSFANSTPRTTFVAGGATLPALGYEGTTALTNNPSLPTNGNCVLGYFKVLTGVTTQYAQTGSGFGKKVFDGLPGGSAGVNGPAAPLGTSSGASNGFGAPASLGLTDPDITGTDAPLLQSEYSQFVTDKASTRGEPVEVPSIIGSVALLYNDPDLGTTQINLTDSQILSIVEGKVTNWSQLGKPARPFTFVYRSDGSGTTFSFSNHLTTVYPTSGLNASQNFAPPSSGTLSPPYVIGTPPSNFVGASGNPGVVQAILATPGALGYVEGANALSAVKEGKKGVNFSKVNNFDPIKDLPSAAFALTYSNVVVDDAIVTSGGPAKVAALTGVARAGAVQLVNPSAYGTSTKGYPILAVTYLLFSTKGNGATNATNLQQLVVELNSPGSFGSTKINTHRCFDFRAAHRNHRLRVARLDVQHAAHYGR